MVCKNKFDLTFSGHGAMTFAPVPPKDHFDAKTRYSAKAGRSSVTLDQLTFQDDPYLVVTFD